MVIFDRYLTTDFLAEKNIYFHLGADITGCVEQHLSPAEGTVDMRGLTGCQQARPNT